MEVDSMKRAFGVLAVIAALALVACEETPTVPPTVAAPVFTPEPTPEPTPTPNPSLVGLWKIANQVPNGHPLAGYAIDVSSHSLATGEIRGRVVLKYNELTGLLRGTARDISGGRLHVDWQTDFSGAGDTDNGSMDVDAARRQMDGMLKFEFGSFGGVSYSYTGVVLRK